METLITKESFDKILLQATVCGASDIYIGKQLPIIASVHGEMQALTERVLRGFEVDNLFKEIISAHFTADLVSGKTINQSYIVKVDKERMERFRVNIVSSQVYNSYEGGIHATFRHIPQVPPSVSMLHVEPDIIAALERKQGLILVTGSTGSGKSTLLAAIIRYYYEQSTRHRKIVTYENPVEFVHPQWHKHVVLFQHEIPGNIPTFEKAIEESLRGNPSIILVGEARDRETLSASTMAALTGHLVLTTVHTNSVAETIQRMIQIYPADERNFYQANILGSLQMIITQTLVGKAEGGRIALREYLVFDDDIRKILLETDVKEIANVVNKMVSQYGQSMAEDAINKLTQGLITDHTYQFIKRSYYGVGSS